MSSIYEFVKEQRDRYRSDTIQIADGYEFSQYQTLRTIELYHGSKFTSGDKDSLGREKPFYNITKFRVNVATRATDRRAAAAELQSQGGRGVRRIQTHAGRIRRAMVHGAVHRGDRNR